MAVKYARAQDGEATTQGGTGGLDLSQLMGDQDPKLQKLVSYATLLKAMKPATSYVPPNANSAMDTLLKGAEMQAKGYGPGAEYYMGMEPGGLADVLAGWIGGMTGRTPNPSAGARVINRVPMPTMEQAQALGGGGQFVTAPTSPEEDALFSQIMSSLKDIINGPDTAAAAGPQGQALKPYVVQKGSAAEAAQASRGLPGSPPTPEMAAAMQNEDYNPTMPGGSATVDQGEIQKMIAAYKQAEYEAERGPQYGAPGWASLPAQGAQAAAKAVKHAPGTATKALKKGLPRGFGGLQ